MILIAHALHNPLLDLQDPHSLPRLPPTRHHSGYPRDAPGFAISPESARSSRAPQLPSQHQPRADSTLWAAGWVPASWSWPSGPCCLGEYSQGPSAAPGSPRRCPPRPTRGDPALTGTDPVFHWLTVLFISLKTHPHLFKWFPPPYRSPPTWEVLCSLLPGWTASERPARYDWSEGLSITIRRRDLVGCCPNLPPETPPHARNTASRAGL